jgi:hypothetical protein
MKISWIFFCRLSPLLLRNQLRCALSKIQLSNEMHSQFADWWLFLLTVSRSLPFHQKTSREKFFSQAVEYNRSPDPVFCFIKPW